MKLYVKNKKPLDATYNSECNQISRVWISHNTYRQLHNYAHQSGARRDCVCNFSVNLEYYYNTYDKYFGKTY